MRLLSPVRSVLGHRRAGRGKVARPAAPGARLLVTSLEDRTVPATLFVGTPGAPVDATHFSNYNDAFEAATSGDIIQVRPGAAIRSVGPDIVVDRTGGGLFGTSEMTVYNFRPILPGELVTISGGGGADEKRLVVRTTPVSGIETRLTFDRPFASDHSFTPNATVTTLGTLGVNRALTIQGDPGALAPITSNVLVMSGAIGVTFRWINFSGPDELRLDQGSHQTSILNSVVTRVKGQNFNGVSQGNVVDGCVITESVVMNNWDHSRVTNNLFTATARFAVEGYSASDVLIRGNTFNLSGEPTTGIRIVNSYGIEILNNSITIADGGLFSWGIEAFSVPSPDNRVTELTIENNVIDTGGQGIGLHATKDSTIAGSLVITATGNDFHNNYTAIDLRGDGQFAGSINLGFPQNPATPGANNFRGFDPDRAAFGHFAIFLHYAPFASVPARGNIWSVDDPNTVVKDRFHNPTVGGGSGGTGTIDVGPTQLTPDQQHAQTLFAQFVGRPADAAELDLWVGRLVHLGRAGVAGRIARSGEALGRLVDKTYQRFLGRLPDDASRARWVRSLQAGGRVESLVATLLRSSEYFERVKGTFGDSNTSFVQSLYVNLRGRYATEAELSAGVLALRRGKAAFVSAAVNAREARQREVRQYFARFEHRAIDVTQDEIDARANSRLDLLRVQIGFASSQFYYENG
jgi:hypothetical protein